MKNSLFILKFPLVFIGIYSLNICGIFGHLDLQASDDSYDVKFYFIDIHADNASMLTKGTTTILVQMNRNVSDTVDFDLANKVDVDSVYCNAQKVLFVHDNNLLKIIVATPLYVQELISFKVYHTSGIEASADNRGIVNKTLSNGKGVTYTLSEPYSSRDWFPCKQILTDKADSAYIFITVDSSLMAGSNGLLTDIVSLPEGKRRFEWKTYYPVAYYLLSFAVADYLDYSFYAPISDVDSVFVQNYIYNDSVVLQQSKEDIDKTADIIKVFSDKFGPYPFRNEKYGHCMAPLGGGMEHQTMTTLNSFSFSLIAHELAHQWFGDYVTCSDWQHIWINEGFASYAEFIATEALKDTTDQYSWLRWTHSTAMEFPNGSIYVPAEMLDSVKRIFNNNLSYRKGASMIHMIRQELEDDDLFYNVLRSFLTRYASSVSNAEDFRMVLEELSQRDFSWFFHQWYYGEGYPIFDISWQQKNDSLLIRVEQTTSAPDITPFFNVLLDFSISLLKGDTTIRLRQSMNPEEFRIPFNKRIVSLRADEDEWLLAKFNSIDKIQPDQGNSVFQVYPNPARDEIYIESSEGLKPYSIEIFDQRGIMRKKENAFFFFSIIKITDLEPAVYQVVISSDEIREVYPVVKL